VKHSGLVGWNLNVAHQSWVAPDTERVVGETASANNFLVVRAPSKTGDLGASVDAVHSCPSGRVPEVDMTVV